MRLAACCFALLFLLIRPCNAAVEPLAVLGWGTLDCVAYAPVGTLPAFATGGGGGIYLWGAGDTPLRNFHTAGHRVIALQFSADATRIVSGGIDGTARLWDVATGQLLRTMLHDAKHDVEAVAISPDGTCIASAAGNTIKLWSATTGAELRTLSGQYNTFSSLAFSPDGLMLASGNQNSTAQLWDVATGQLLKTFRGHLARVSGVLFNPTGTQLFTSSWDRTARLWDVATSLPLRVYRGHTLGLTSLALAPAQQRLLTAANDGKLRLWDVNATPTLKLINNSTITVTRCAFAPDGQSFLTVDTDHKLKQWDVARTTVTRTLTGFTPPVNCVAVSPDGMHIVSAHDDYLARLWDAHNGQFYGYFWHTSAPVYACDFTSHGTCVATGDKEGRLRLFRVKDGSLIFDSRYGSTSVKSLVSSLDGSVIGISFCNSWVEIWNGLTFKRTYSLSSSDGRTNSFVALTSQSTRILSACANGNIYQDRLTATYPYSSTVRAYFGHQYAVSAICAETTGTHFLSGGVDGSVRYWDLASSQTQKLLRAGGPMIIAVALSPDGKRAIALEGDEMGIIPPDSAALNLPVAEGKTSGKLPGQTDQARSVVFSPDGTRIIIGYRSGQIMIWPASHLEAGVLNWKLYQ